ncbi:MAG: Vms1/Ankzf1 family peptidyl-tRNA hydrolase [Natronomonas sp.]|uniref:Vms1/Ankzf1 family peptidyl-tRNA hydrolase n=1 Tax=Natronomonas sp. TaxID=2184060 RepID=UPI00286FF9C6|nr:Vms1/Ankzf1 family peptidyl-tRNA hydrolase [Natronomonas sp.]MDR9431424.1 Vms1/Ankzf1 family peptidyl-tRNA hydrolase [Natronomonas sp.]
MLDDLLGRTELKAQIEALEERRDRLEARLEAESERRADAVTEKQEAEERANRLEDRIADLEGRLEAAERPDDDSGVGFRYEETLRGGRADAVLDRLASLNGGPEGVLTAYVDAEPPPELRDLLGDRTPLVARASPCLVCADDAGLVAVALRPPVAPEPFAEWAESPRIERSWVRPTGRFALAVVRSDIFAVGVYEGAERVAYEGFESRVKSDHSKGGFSQGRFERLRDEQIAAHVEDCVETLDSVGADRRYVVGDRRLIDEFDADATAAVDASGKPKAALEDAFTDFWSVRLYGL